MKKLLGLLLLSSSLFSMELAYKLQTPYNRFNRVTSALLKNPTQKLSPAVCQVEKAFSVAINTPKTPIDASSIRAPHSLADAQLYHGKKGFVVLHDDKKHVIEKRFMDSVTHNITKEELKSFLKTGFFALNQTNDGKFTLKAHYRLPGGGPLFGKIMYWATKVTCYTVLMAATAGMVIAGGSIGIDVSKGTKGLKMAATTTNIKIASVMASSGAQGYLAYAGGVATVTQASGAAVFSGAGIAAGMATPCVLASGIIEVGGAPTCAKVVGAGLAAGHSGTGIVAGIEFISLTVGLACGLTPTP